ncbi:precorrin-6Y C5,15-methyltransferase (decarboxylating) [Desulfotomaculum arcticum]|uniref:Precorrin-6Y C5,15-methyltransferase (Decarboxylating) n=1 Tax=Desulfotruncus arcticus DSM 17038 TaxID=1121424 RepID=A0A1I2RWK2_9FIRM|nr:precorrin-6y C5,15-methyltransferase (decarboxylating) subunit CbiE [Desulfotruncus arcticus]SFG44443.1 precorrin-6Y C5,15-methyltransferase (decarboxylating) [Desulfotomaculum arcticum] [Desulfotruncus arcticus DSM 17038]
MANITIVGVGPGSKEYLTRAAETAIDHADVLIGGHRQLEMFRSLPAEKIAITAELGPVLQLIRSKALNGEKVVVLSSGDPGFYGILGTINKYLPDLNVNVIPGISSVQVACAKIGITWDDAVLTSCHGRDILPLVAAVKKYNKVITLTGPKQNPTEIARALLEGGAINKSVYIACNLSYQDEVIISTDLKKLSSLNQSDFTNCVMVIYSE